MSKKIIIDTDPGVDDAMAIQFALNSPELEVLGLTTVFGNVKLELCTENALRLLDLGGRNDIPVAAGAATPLQGPFPGGAAFVHGEDGQGNTNKPKSNSKVLEIPASEFLANTIKKYPNEITICTLGPLTNLALLIQNSPEIIDLVKEIIIMGGNIFIPGNITPAAEANIWADPLAADLVLGQSWPITLIGLDATHQTILPNKLVDSIRDRSNSALNQHVTKAYQFYQKFYNANYEFAGTYIHDSAVIAYSIRPNLFGKKAFPIKVETADVVSKGKTWPLEGEPDFENRPQLAAWRDRPAVDVVLEVDSEGFLELLLSRLV